MRRVGLALAFVAAVVAGAAWYLAATSRGQDMALATSIPLLFGEAPVVSFDGLRVFVCGAASPLGAPGSAQTCVAVLAGEQLYIVDAGAGAAATFQFAGESLAPLQALLITHFHSDHITGIPDVNLNSWVMGRAMPLQVVGPVGVERVVAGFNEALALDYGYRVAHHGAELLPPELGPMQAKVIDNGVVLDRHGLVVTAFPVDHSPVAPAVGYRFDYGGRSVVISGDTVVTDTLRSAAQDADLLLHDVLSRPIVRALEAAARSTGRLRQAKVLADIQSYHAGADELGELADRAAVGQLALYHFVPVPSNFLMRRIYQRELPKDAVLTVEGTVFELPRGSDEIRIHAP